MNKMIKSAGGNKMRSYDLDAKKFSVVKTDMMFPKMHKSMHYKPEEVKNINKSVKPIKKMKGAQK